MRVFEQAAGHEQVVFCHDEASGLRAIIAIYSTALGPGLGGTRFYPYSSESAALSDVLDLSQAMAYKAALAGLDLGGGKAVILGNPTTDKTEALLRAYGRFVQSLGGRYITACDVGTYSEDMDIVARESDFVTGRTTANGGAGDSSVLTAYGVFEGMRAAAGAAWGDPSLAGRRVAIAGVGKVGSHLAGSLVEAGAEVVVSDVDPNAVHRLVARLPMVEVADPDRIAAESADIFSPCAMGGAIDDHVLDMLKARVVCGGANNQLTSPEMGKGLAERGILYAPDYCVNAGGLIQVDDERHGFSFERAKSRAARIYDTTTHVFEVAASRGVTPDEAAHMLADDRIRAVGRLRGLWVRDERRL